MPGVTFGHPALLFLEGKTTICTREFHHGRLSDQVWHPSEHPNGWCDHWARLMDRRKTEHFQQDMYKEEEAAECITGESKTSSQEGSQSTRIEAQCIHPSSLYEQVKRLQITSSADEDDKDWVTVPARRPQAHDPVGKPSACNRDEKPLAGKSARRRNRYNRGRGRGRRSDQETRAFDVPGGHGIPFCACPSACTILGPSRRNQSCRNPSPT